MALLVIHSTLKLMDVRHVLKHVGALNLGASLKALKHRA